MKEVPETKTYPDVGDEWHWVPKKGFKLMCCGCRLIHTFQFRIVQNGKKRKIEIKVDRDDRATGQARRVR